MRLQQGWMMDRILHSCCTIIITIATTMQAFCNPNPHHRTSAHIPRSHAPGLLAGRTAREYQEGYLDVCGRGAGWVEEGVYMEGRVVTREEAVRRWCWCLCEVCFREVPRRFRVILMHRYVGAFASDESSAYLRRTFLGKDMKVTPLRAGGRGMRDRGAR